MQSPHRRSGWLLALVLGFVSVGAARALAEDSPAPALPEFEYMLTLPEPFDAEQSYPALLALPPGPQDAGMVEIADRAYWRHGQRRGWIVVSPVAPGGELFFDGSEVLIPSLIAELRDAYNIENDVFHIAGISNGGISAFRIAENDPETYCSMLVLPGLPGTSRDFERLHRLKGISVDMMVGEGDVRWADRMRETRTRLEELEIPVWLRVLPGVGHVIADSVSASELFDRLDERRKGCDPGESDASGN